MGYFKSSICALKQGGAKDAVVTEDDGDDNGVYDADNGRPGIAGYEYDDGRDDDDDGCYDAYDPEEMFNL